MMGSGWSWIGEAGPELMHMPAGASVVPLPPGGYNNAMNSSGFGGARTMEVVLKIGEEEMKRVVLDVVNDALRDQVPNATQI